jgi:hypothetical protein
MVMSGCSCVCPSLSFLDLGQVGSRGTSCLVSLGATPTSSSKFEGDLLLSRALQPSRPRGFPRPLHPYPDLPNMRLPFLEAQWLRGRVDTAAASSTPRSRAQQCPMSIKLWSLWNLSVFQIVCVSVSDSSVRAVAVRTAPLVRELSRWNKSLAVWV